MEKIILKKVYAELKKIRSSMITHDDMTRFIETVEILSNSRTMEQIYTSERDIEALKKSVAEIMANINNLEMLKILLCHRNGPDPEGQLSEWAKKQLAEARKTPPEKYVSMEEIEKEFL